MVELGKLIVPSAPRPANDLKEYARNVEIYAREVEQAFRQIELWAAGVREEVARLDKVSVEPAAQVEAVVHRTESQFGPHRRGKPER